MSTTGMSTTVGIIPLMLRSNRLPSRLNIQPILLLAGAALFAAVLASCSGDAKTPVAFPGVMGTPTKQAASSDTSEDLKVVVISTDLSSGPNRLVFGLLNPDSTQLVASEADLVLSYQGPESVLDVTTKATFREWPLGNRGVYTAQVELPQSGLWVLDAEVRGVGQATRSGTGVIQVKEQPSTPAVGAQALASRNKTAEDVNSLDELTTANPPDPDLYSLTIAEAVRADLPLVVVFATPAFCATATCGPQVEVVEQLKEAYRGRANFIHVEIFDNPLEVQGEPEKATVSPVVNEWELLSEPWTFIVNREGLIAGKFEAFTTYMELEEALVETLK